MANEITCVGKLTATKSGSTVTGDTTKQMTMSGSQLYTITQTIGTSTEQIVFGTDLIAEGISQIWLKNLDSTNYIEVGLNTPVTQIFTKIKAGETAGPFRAYNDAAAASPAYYAKANTAACNLQIVAVGATT